MAMESSECPRAFAPLRPVRRLPQVLLSSPLERLVSANALLGRRKTTINHEPKLQSEHPELSPHHLQ